MFCDTPGLLLQLCHKSYYHLFGKKVFTYIVETSSPSFVTRTYMLHTHIDTSALFRAGPIPLPLFSSLIAVYDFILYSFAHHGR